MNQSTLKTMFSSESDEWTTPDWFYEVLNEDIGFSLDPAATHENHKCPVYFTIEDDGLKQSWQGHRVFVNPPYSKQQLKKWVEKGYLEGLKENTLVVMLIPARTDTRYWHDFVMKAKEIYFIKGRLKFGNSKNSAPFPSALVMFDGEYSMPSIFTMDLKEMKRCIK